MEKIKNVGYGIVFGLAILALLAMGTTGTIETASAAEEIEEESPDSVYMGSADWEKHNEESGAYAISVGAKGVEVGFEYSWEDGHGAAVGMAMRGYQDHGNGEFDWVTTAEGYRTGDSTGTWQSDHFWTVIATDVWHEISDSGEWVQHEFELHYLVEHERDRFWGGTEYNYHNTHIYGGNPNAPPTITVWIMD